MERSGVEAVWTLQDSEDVWNKVLFTSCCKPFSVFSVLASEGLREDLFSVSQDARS